MMKQHAILILLMGYAILSCKEEKTINLKNSLAEERFDEVIILSRSHIEEKLSISEGNIPLFKVGEQILPYQLDDMDGNGIWDEVAILLNFAAGESKVVTCSQVPAKEYPEFEKRTNLRLGIHQEEGGYKEVDYYEALPCSTDFKIIAQGESVSWENDKIAFRVYFDCRNVKDLFGKLKPELIIDKIHTPEIKNYHALNDWGMDVLHCGSSLGLEV